MKPVNSKSMFHMLCSTMEKLETNQIDVHQAGTMSKLIGQATNLLNYELKRAVVMATPEYKKEHRNLEMKEFDSLPE